jgi:hypothetical protein
MTDDDRPPLDESLTTERAMRTGVPEGTIAFPDRLPDPVDRALDALDAIEAPTGTQPWLTITEAAKACQVDRRTIRRHLDAKPTHFPNAYRGGTDGHWLIPVGDLQAAELTLYAPSPADVDPDEAAPPPDALEELRSELDAERHRRELAERDRDVAQAVARERERLITAQEVTIQSLRALGPGPTSPPSPPTSAAPRRARWWRR